MENENSHRGSSVKLITTNTSYEILIKAIQENKAFMLSEKMEETLLMFQEVRRLYFKYKSREKVMAVLQKAPYSMPQKTAFDYVTKAPELFSFVPKTMTRDFYIDIHFESIENTYRMAEAMSNPNAMAKADANRAYAIEKLMGTNKAIDKDLLRLPDILAGFHPEWYPNVPGLDTNQYLKIKQLYTNKKDRQRKIELEAEDIDFEEVEITD